MFRCETEFGNEFKSGIKIFSSPKTMATFSKLVPPEGHRHGCRGARPQRVGRRHQPVLRVLVEVEEHPITALLLPPGHRDSAGIATLELPPDGDGRVPHVDEVVRRDDRDEHVQSAAATGLDERREAELVEHLLARRGHASHVVEVVRRRGVEVEPQLVRMGDVRRGHGPGVEGDGTHLDGPQDRRTGGRVEQRAGTTAREAHVDAVHVPGHGLRQVLLEEVVGGLADTVRPALQGGRTPAHLRHHRVADGEVVLEHVALGHPREHRLVGARQPDRHAVHVHGGRRAVARGWHVCTVLGDTGNRKHAQRRWHGHEDDGHGGDHRRDSTRRGDGIAGGGEPGAGEHPGRAAPRHRGPGRDHRPDVPLGPRLPARRLRPRERARHRRSSSAYPPRAAKAVSVGRVRGAVAQGEGGLLGLAVPPGSDPAYVFAYYTGARDNRVVRIAWDGDRLGRQTPILTGIPKNSYHDGGRLLVGPDSTLFVGTGDAGQSGLAQDRRSLAGKVLRITFDGRPAPGNPFPGSPVYSLGHRNVQGLAFDSAGRLWASEFGEKDVDELNLIRPGRNYGWPVHEGASKDGRYVNPAAQWSPTATASPSGIAILDDVAYVASLRGEVLWQVPLSGTKAGTPIALRLGDRGRLRTVAVAPDGALWLVTSNTDGRGSPRGRDDRILRLTAR